MNQLKKYVEMKETKGTKGAWFVSDEIDIRSTHIDCTGIIAQVYDGLNTHISRMDKEKYSSNAKLIAAAPDLLEALQSLCFLNSCEEEGLLSGRPKPEDWLEAFREAELAISKALGE